MDAFYIMLLSMICLSVCPLNHFVLRVNLNLIFRYLSVIYEYIQWCFLYCFYMVSLLQPDRLSCRPNRPIRAHMRLSSENNSVYITRRTNLYLTCSVHGLCTRMIINTCWYCDRIAFGVNCIAPGSWNTSVTMSLPMWRFRSS